MSMSTKYANLPDIDTAPDVYETEDAFPASHDSKGDSSDEELGLTARPAVRGKNGETGGREELDGTHLSPEEASRKFRKAEKKHHRPRIQYVYPPSPTSDTSPPSTPSVTPALPLSYRLRMLQTELSTLETELADPSNPLLQREREAGHDPGELIRGMVDVKNRLGKITKVKEGKGKLVSVVLGEDSADEQDGARGTVGEGKDVGKRVLSDQIVPLSTNTGAPDVKDIVEMDRRVGELEKSVGASSTALDELSPLPPPLLPMLTRLNAQLTLLTQPRHVDSISRRLKLLLSDLERVSSASAHPHGSQRRQSSHHAPTPASPHPAASSGSAPTIPAALYDQLTPILTRLAPLLPHIPHVLTRLRTLSALHTSAAGFQNTLESLEEEQKRVRAVLEELERAVNGVESSIKENEEVIKKNVKELDDRVEDVGRRVDELRVSKG
ncbi:uncharacterized protein B0H18DRAFT_1012102 [Fomitopsis serialis]|uniref:uncharacterized protein n=1 Tax=Fomitopsis serialis TaxID=139415 RepID=UPI00200827E9|nr:uncharacterized protein B0H18DRAFT_1012102 [Neoantrodia serialis]KAH9924421.1 hypothetical protein B0H18DRAFT_1012102 [Neoantrodia serialis]